MSDAKTIGTFFELGSCQAIEGLAKTGLDYIIIDTEHNYYSEESVANYIRAAENGNLLPYVRIGDVRRPYVLRMLDIGARGLIVPNITTVDEVEQLVSYAKFPPVGKRGYCPNRTSGWGQDTWAHDIHGYMQECNDRCKLIPQCETKEALEHIEEIVAVDGVDGIFVGPCDLSIALGIPLEFESPVLTQAIQRILRACEQRQKMAMIFSGTAQETKYWLEKGFDSVTCGLDISILIESYKSLLGTCR